jgi:hypothetical protein
MKKGETMKQMGGMVHHNRIDMKSKLNPAIEDENAKRPEVTSEQLQYTQKDPRGPHCCDS